jgi:oligopeptide transport system permease protein
MADVVKNPLEDRQAFKQKPSRSLWQEAVKRLWKNKMAVLGFWIVVVFAFFSLFANFLPIFNGTTKSVLVPKSSTSGQNEGPDSAFSYDEKYNVEVRTFDSPPYAFQVLEHQNLPPSWGFKRAGEQYLEKVQRSLYLDAALDGRIAVSPETQTAYDQRLEGERARLQQEAQQQGWSSFELEDRLYSTENNLYREFLLEAAALGEVDLNEDEKKVLADTVNRINDSEHFPEHNRVYLLGTDSLGRDMFARIVYGGQISIMIGLLGTLFSVMIGVFLGALSGFMGGWVDTVIMRIVEVLYSLPYMLLVIIFMAFSGTNIVNLFIALAMVSWLTVSRVVRAQIMSLKNSEYVEAAKSMGAGSLRIIFGHLVPNTMGVIVVFTALRIPAFILAEAFLSFLGIGVSAPYASWGSLIQDGIGSMTTEPWRLWGPAIAMTVFLFGMNFLGDGLRDALDPKSKNQL